MNITLTLHAICAVVVQGPVGCIIDGQAYGIAIACTSFVAREYAQAEYRWIKRFGDGYRHKMPWRGGFNLYAWDVASLMDSVVPVVACTGLCGCVLIFS